MKKFLKEFKSFAMRGNVLDMAVGVVIGAAFGKIVTSLVADVIMPLISLITGGVDFTAWAITLKAATAEKAAVAITYGNFIQVVLDFLIIAWAIFLMIKGINKLTEKKKKEVKSEEPVTPEEILLLREIRDSLKNK